MNRPLPPKRPLPPAPRQAYVPPKIVVVDIDTARYWAKFAAGENRAALWADVVRRMDKAAREGRDVECRWHSVQSRRHPGFPSHGFLEVVDVAPPAPVKFRSRVRPSA